MDEPLPCLENRLKTLATGERPQERLEKLGPAALSDSELLAMLLRSGTRGNDVLTLATRLIAEAGSLAGLITWRETDFRKLNGIGRVKALQLVTVMEMARRVVGQQTGEAPLLNRADLVAAHLAPIVAGLEVEKFCYMTFPILVPYRLWAPYYGGIGRYLNIRGWEVGKGRQPLPPLDSGLEFGHQLALQIRLGALAIWASPTGAEGVFLLIGELAHSSLRHVIKSGEVPESDQRLRERRPLDRTWPEAFLRQRLERGYRAMQILEPNLRNRMRYP